MLEYGWLIEAVLLIHNSHQNNPELSNNSLHAHCRRQGDNGRDQRIRSPAMVQLVGPSTCHLKYAYYHYIKHPDVDAVCELDLCARCSACLLGMLFCS